MLAQDLSDTRTQSQYIQAQPANSAVLTEQSELEHPTEVSNETTTRQPLVTARNQTVLNFAGPLTSFTTSFTLSSRGGSFSGIL